VVLNVNKSTKELMAFIGSIGTFVVVASTICLILLSPLKNGVLRVENILEMLKTKSEQAIKSNKIHSHEQSNNPSCPYCHSKNVYGMSRVVGYFSKIENWNKSKKAELKRRQQGNYWYDEK